jgi:23S rRNA (pseudouridine1915-N3)-methyltransferase
MKIAILAVGTQMPTWVETAFAVYQKRLLSTCPLQLIEVRAGQRYKNQDKRTWITQEEEKLLAALPKPTRLVALDERGQNWTTSQLAQHLQNWQCDGRTVSFLIGGADGLGAQCLKKAEHVWSLSALTFPHPLVRVILIEQIYRAFSLLKGHPYHRE